MGWSTARNSENRSNRSAGDQADLSQCAGVEALAAGPEPQVEPAVADVVEGEGVTRQRDGMPEVRSRDEGS